MCDSLAFAVGWSKRWNPAVCRLVLLPGPWWTNAHFRSVVVRKKSTDADLTLHVSCRHRLERVFVMQATQDRPLCHAVTFREAVA